MVIQSPMSGDLTWHTTPGVKLQWFGKVTKYDKRVQLWFRSATKKDDTLRIRFNDGGHAAISGGISWEMPTDPEHLTMLHTKFGSQQAIEEQLVRTIINKSVYMTGPLMSSTESYAGRRNELLQLIEDQASGGVFQTRTVMKLEKDPITGVDRKVSVVQLVLDEHGKPQRVEESPLQEFAVRTFNLSIEEIKYEGKVEEQIAQQQEAVMQVQIAIAEGKRAEQQVLTTQKQGEATAAKEEWAQRAVAAKEVTQAEMVKKVAETKAEQMLAVAKLDAEAAKQFKAAEIARGEGEAARRKLVMEADGALEKKLEAYVETQKAYARAISEYKGQLVPSVVMGGSKESGGGVQQLIELLSIKAARDLSLDITPKLTSPAKDK
ncbi:hypothetical protein AYO40_06990 [Planctomycetaceae bacterium SCGC AG-212-D15]|nr:hypothetical protein AYO40_06990 [Planctomycetaceae bacterium SCGC AG-212-D15]